MLNIIVGPGIFSSFLVWSKNGLSSIYINKTKHRKQQVSLKKMPELTDSTYLILLLQKMIMYLFLSNNSFIKTLII